MAQRSLAGEPPAGRAPAVTYREAIAWLASVRGLVAPRERGTIVVQATHPVSGKVLQGRGHFDERLTGAAREEAGRRAFAEACQRLGALLEG